MWADERVYEVAWHFAEALLYEEGNGNVCTKLVQINQIKSAELAFV